MTFYSTVYQRAAPGFHNFYHGFLDTPLFLTAQWHRRKYLTFLWRLPSPRKPVLSRKVSNRKTSFSSQPPLSISKYLQKLSQHFKATDLCDVKGISDFRISPTLESLFTITDCFLRLLFTEQICKLFISQQCANN